MFVQELKFDNEDLLSRDVEEPTVIADGMNVARNRMSQNAVPSPRHYCDTCVYAMSPAAFVALSTPCPPRLIPVDDSSLV